MLNLAEVHYIMIAIAGIGLTCECKIDQLEDLLPNKYIFAERLLLPDSSVSIVAFECFKTSLSI